MADDLFVLSRPEVGPDRRSQLPSGVGLVVGDGEEPDGGVLGVVNGLKPKGLLAENEWLVTGVDIPQKVIDEVLEKLDL